MNEQQYRRVQSGNCLLPSRQLLTRRNSFNTELVSSLPETFVSSLRQLFSILDKTNCGYIPFDLFKHFFDGSSTTLDFLNELEIESKSNNYFITFHLLINVIERSLSTSKQPPPSILIPKPTRSSMSFISDRSTETFIVTPKTNQIEREIPVIYRSSNGVERSSHHLSNPMYYTKRSRRNNQINFSMIRSLKQFELERDLLIQTCDTLDRVKFYLTDRLVDMKEKQISYCRHLTTAETTGLVPQTMYNRDLIADLFKLAHTVIKDVNYDFKKLSDRSSSSSSCSSFNGMNNQYQKQLKEKDDQIKQLETEKRVLLKELIEMRQQHGTVIPIEIS